MHRITYVMFAQLNWETFKYKREVKSVRFKNSAKNKYNFPLP